MSQVVRVQATAFYVAVLRGELQEIPVTDVSHCSVLYLLHFFRAYSRCTPVSYRSTTQTKATIYLLAYGIASYLSIRLEKNNPPIRAAASASYDIRNRILHVCTLALPE